MYHAEARRYILKLIRLQRKLADKGYLRTDQQQVNAAASHLQKYLDYYPYNTDETMRGFFHRNADCIHRLLPGKRHPGYHKLELEFNAFANQ